MSVDGGTRHSSSQGFTVRAGGRGGRRAAWGRSTSSSAAVPRRGGHDVKTSSMRVGRSRKAISASPRSTRATASVRVRRVADPVVAEAVDELDVELSGSPATSRRPRRRRRRPRGALVGSAASRASASSSRAGRLARPRPARGGRRRPGAWGRSRARGRRSRRAREHPGALGRPLLRVEGERGLVAVVTVGDQKLALGEERPDTFGIVEPPEPRALDGEIRLAVRAARAAQRRRRAGRSARAGRAWPAAAAAGSPSGPACVRSWGRTTPRLVRLDPERADDAVPRPRDAVGADVVLLERPDGGPARGRGCPPSRQARKRRAPPPPPSRPASGGRRCAGCARGSSSRCSAEITS